MKRLFEIIAAIIVILFFSIRLYGQDIHFSQFYNSPLALNPANTGNFIGEWRVMNHYRNQWTALLYPYRTLSIGADKRFYYYNDVISAGLYFINDKSGAINLQVNKIYFSGSYKKSFTNYTITGGLQLGYVNKQISFNDLTFPDQYDFSIGDFNLQLTNNEFNSSDKLSYLDVNTGILGTTVFHKAKLEGGVAFYHVNFPKESFAGSDARLPVRYVFHGKATVALNSIFFVRPQFLYMQQKQANNLVLGSDLGVKVKNNYKLSTLYAGCYVRTGFSRNADATILTCGIEWYRFALGLSYDFNFDLIHPVVNSRGSFEISLIYTSFNTIPSKITIPCSLY